MDISEQALFIGGQWTPSESGETYESLDPFTGRIATRAASATVADIGRAVEAAQAALLHGPLGGAAGRADIGGSSLV